MRRIRSESPQILWEFCCWRARKTRTGPQMKVENSFCHLKAETGLQYWEENGSVEIFPHTKKAMKEEKKMRKMDVRRKILRHWMVNAFNLLSAAASALFIPFVSRQTYKTSAAAATSQLSNSICVCLRDEKNEKKKKSLKEKTNWRRDGEVGGGGEKVSRHENPSWAPQITTVGDVWVN